MVQVRKKSRRRPRTPRLAAARHEALDDLLVSGLFKALCDPFRCRLLACVAKCGRACSVGEVAECCHLDLSTVSRHLKTLALAGLMESKKRGTSVYYSVRYEYLAGMLQSLAAAIDACRPSATCGPKGRVCDGCC